MFLRELRRRSWVFVLVFVVSVAGAGQLAEESSRTAFAAPGEEKQTGNADPAENKHDGGNAAPGGAASAAARG